jgi:hypothetical protein
MTDRIIHQRHHVIDLRVVPYNLQMTMDWGSQINVEYSGSGHCVQCLYKYCFKGPTQREKIKIDSEQMQDSKDEIKFFIYGQVSCSRSAMWHFYGYQDYPASTPAVCSSKCKLNSNWVYSKFWLGVRLTSLLQEATTIRISRVCQFFEEVELGHKITNALSEQQGLFGHHGKQKTLFPSPYQ